MDKDNKYYGIIENLVKQHKKYPEYEAILDDIIDDVYAHSEVIINSITNESVIEAYLQKVINTSMVTVPKKLGVRKYVKQVVVNPIRQKISTPEKIESEIPIENAVEREMKVNTELVDKMINLAETPKEEVPQIQEEDLSLAEDISEEAPVEEVLSFSQNEEIPEEETETIESIENVEEFAETEPKTPAAELENFETELENSFFAEEESKAESAEEIIKQENFTEQEDIKELVESDIQSEPEEVVYEKAPAEESDLNLLFEDVNEKIDDSEEIQTEENAEIALEIDENNLAETVSIDVVPSPVEDVLELSEVSEDYTEQVQDTPEAVVQDTLDISETLDLNSENELEEINDGFTESQDDLMLSDNMDMQEISGEDSALLEAAGTDEEDFIVSDGDLPMEAGSGDFLEEVVPETVEAVQAKTIDYSVFASKEDIISEIDSDEDEIRRSIAELDRKYSNINIIKVFNLRYKQNCNISQISQELNMEASDVYLALSKISDVV